MTILPNQSAQQNKGPLPRGNFRFGKRTPQNGVEIERKWARPDYYLPGTKESDRLVQIETTRV
jgi:formate dehydrogenase major subunit